ncbi:hypothetical protein [uncultured Methanobrevibacter sp.]|uniref:hypothetical protein n=1 Tax=uncultured Methanobrevibacter sp. TaxID=253161 RepID=UPI0025E61255|nr:hypothetical protein [uncultured Methanobrevibacter sp.]
MKYLSMAQAKRQHQYLGLPGNFKTRLPQEVVFPNMDIGRADEYYLTDDDLLINLEEESGHVTGKTLKKFSKYIIFAADRFNKDVYLAVVCHKNPNKSVEYYQHSPSVIIKVHYYYFKQNHLWSKYENLINKVRYNEELTESETLDIAFVSKFISKKHILQVIETLIKVFNNAIIDDKVLKMDVGVILGAMILKHVNNIKKQNKLLRDLNMGQFESELHELVYDEFGDVLDKKDEEIEAKDKELGQKDKEIEELSKSNMEYKAKIKQLLKLEDLNSPEAKKILNSLIVGK